MDHNVGMGRKNFGRGGQQRVRPSPDRRPAPDRRGPADRRPSADQEGGRWGERQGERQWPDNRNK